MSARGNGDYFFPRSLSEGPVAVASKAAAGPRATIPVKELHGDALLLPLPPCFGDDGPFVLFMLGWPGVGRTTLLQNILASDRGDLRTSDNEESTSPFFRPIKGVEYPLQLRSPRISTSTKLMDVADVHKAHAYVLLYDITNADSFKALSEWWHRNAINNVPSFCVGNHLDERDDREVPHRRVSKWAELNHLHHAEISVKTGENVDALVEDIVLLLVEAQTRYMKERGLFHPTNVRSNCFIVR